MRCDSRCRFMGGECVLWTCVSSPLRACSRFWKACCCITCVFLALVSSPFPSFSSFKSTFSCFWVCGTFPRERPKVRRRRCGPFLARGCRRRLSMKPDRESTSGGYLTSGSKKLVLVIGDESSKIFSAAEKNRNPLGFLCTSPRRRRQRPSVRTVFV